MNPEGNKAAKEAISKVFKIGSREWRGIGEIPESGYVMKKEYEQFNAEIKFEVEKIKALKQTLCIAGDILRGKKKPKDCNQFGKKCKPDNPLGAPMVSSEGACAAYYNFSDI